MDVNKLKIVCEDEVVKEAVRSLCDSPSGVCKFRFIEPAYFTFNFCGDDVILTDEIRTAIEEAIGETLVESIEPGLEGEVHLSVPKTLRDKVAAAADSFQD